MNGSPYNYMADVYSLFATFWKLITGVHPVPITNDLKVIEEKIRKGTFFGESYLRDESLKKYLKYIFKHIKRKGLSYNANDRPTVNELLDYLNKNLQAADDVPSYYKALE